MPPIVVNLPPSGPPWWVTSLVGVGGALFGILVTTLLSRGREHQKWLWEKRVERYVQLLQALEKAIASVYWFKNPAVFNQCTGEQLRDEMKILGGTEFRLPVLVSPEVQVLVDQLVGRGADLYPGF